MKRKKTLSPLVLTVAACLLFHPAAKAEQVISIEPDGVLKLSGGTTVRLAGVELSPESASLMAVLLGGREVEIEELQAEELRTVPLPVFVFVNASVVPQPHPPEIKADEEKIMVNELLLRLGAARMLENESGKYRDDFAEAEAEAKNKGHGIWSYEESHLSQSQDQEQSSRAEPGAPN